MYLLHLHLGFRVASGFILLCRLTHRRMPDAVPVRQVGGLPPASFRFHLAVDTLAFWLCAWCYLLRSGLSPVRSCPCRAHIKRLGHGERVRRADNPTVNCNKPRRSSSFSAAICRKKFVTLGLPPFVRRGLAIHPFQRALRQLCYYAVPTASPPSPAAAAGSSCSRRPLRAVWPTRRKASEGSKPTFLFF